MGGGLTQDLKDMLYVWVEKLSIITNYVFLYKLRKDENIMYYNNLWRDIRTSYFRKFERRVVHEDETTRD